MRCYTPGCSFTSFGSDTIPSLLHMERERERERETETETETDRVTETDRGTDRERKIPAKSS